MNKYMFNFEGYELILTTEYKVRTRKESYGLFGNKSYEVHQKYIESKVYDGDKIIDGADIDYGPETIGGGVDALREDTFIYFNTTPQSIIGCMHELGYYIEGKKLNIREVE